MPNQLRADLSGVPAIILAAGASVRLGQPKQILRLAEFGNETLLDRAVRLAREAGADPVFVVLGAHAREIRQNTQLTGCTVLFNPDWQEGMASSLRAGVRASIDNCPSAPGALVMVCDQPALSAEHLRALLAAHAAAPEIPAVSQYASRSGVPVILPRALFPALLALTGDQGARAILQHGASINAVEFADGEWDIDSPGDLPH